MIVITRPEDQAQVFVEKLVMDCNQARITSLGGIPLSDVFCFSPMLDIEFLSFDALDPADFDALIFSSVHGVAGFMMQQVDPEFFNKPVYVVGAATAEVVRGAGFENISFVASCIQDLEGFLSGLGKRGRCLYVRGQDVRSDLSAYISGYCKVYKACLRKNLPPEILRFLDLERIHSVTFFSVRSARNFVELVKQNGLSYCLGSINALCISDAVLECIHPDWSGPVYVSSSPDAKGMVRLVIDVCGHD